MLQYVYLFLGNDMADWWRAWIKGQARSGDSKDLYLT